MAIDTLNRSENVPAPMPDFCRCCIFRDLDWLFCYSCWSWIAEVMLRDHAVVGPAALAARHPDLFPTGKTAQHVMDDFAARLNTPFAYKNHYRETGYLKVAIYRINGTAGKARRALLSSGNLPFGTVAGLLEEIHGKPVTILEIQPRIAAPVTILPAAVALDPENPAWEAPPGDWEPIQLDSVPLNYPPDGDWEIDPGPWEAPDGDWEIDPAPWGCPA